MRQPLHVKRLRLIGVTGFEPATSASRTQRSTRLSYAPRRDYGMLGPLATHVNADRFRTGH